jgi:hypothetical protein
MHWLRHESDDDAQLDANVRLRHPFRRMVWISCDAETMGVLSSAVSIWLFSMAMVVAATLRVS